MTERKSEMFDGPGMPDELTIKLHTIETNLEKLHELIVKEQAMVARLHAERDEAVKLLKRAADRLVEHLDESDVIPDIGAYLGRVAPR